MPETGSHEILAEKAIEIILNFKPTEKIEKDALSEILKLKDDIKKIIACLKNEKGEVLRLRYFNALSQEEIALKINKTKDEVKNILQEGINEIKNGLQSKSLNLLENQKILEQTENIQTPQGFSILTTVISLVVFILVFVFSYFVLQKLFSSGPGLLNKLAVETEDLIKEKITKEEIKQEVLKSNKIKISGSTSVLPLAKKCKEGFSLDFPGYNFQLISSDSDNGINALIKRKINIANSSRPVTFSDREKAQNHKLSLLENRVALDALIVIVSKKNPVEELSLDELKGIFSGEIKDWKQIDFNLPPRLILPVVREKGSGTNDFAISRILEGEDFPGSTLRKGSNEEIINFLLKNEGAISFINSNNYPWNNKDIKYLNIKTYENSIPVSPYEGHMLDERAIRYGEYPLAHYLYLVIEENAPDIIQQYVDWILSIKGQKIVQRSGLIPIEKVE